MGRPILGHVASIQYTQRNNRQRLLLVPKSSPASSRPARPTRPNRLGPAAAARQDGAHCTAFHRRGPARGPGRA